MAMRKYGPSAEEDAKYRELYHSFMRAFWVCLEKSRKQGWDLAIADHGELENWLDEYVGELVLGYMRQRTIWQRCEKSGRKVAA
jgi:hypothetical protein